MPAYLPAQADERRPIEHEIHRGVRHENEHVVHSVAARAAHEKAQPASRAVYVQTRAVVEAAHEHDEIEQFVTHVLDGVCRYRTEQQRLPRLVKHRLHGDKRTDIQREEHESGVHRVICRKREKERDGVQSRQAQRKPQREHAPQAQPMREYDLGNEQLRHEHELIPEQRRE